jgi:nucleotide-binding universal stress UspA family protein
MDTGRIMVALDGSSRAEAALTVAESLASRPDTVLLLVRPAGVPELGAAAQYLGAVAAWLRDRGFERVETVSVPGPAAAVIVDAARTQNADVIVMATSGRGGVARRMAGGVAETVVRSTQTPVFLARVGDMRVSSVRSRAEVGAAS